LIANQFNYSSSGSINQLDSVLYGTPYNCTEVGYGGSLSIMIVQKATVSINGNISGDIEIYFSKAIEDAFPEK